MIRIPRSVQSFAAHAVLGLAVGAASYELWHRLLQGLVVPWLMAAIAAGFGIAGDVAAVAVVHARRARRTRRRRHAHARTRPKTRKDTTPA